MRVVDGTNNQLYYLQGDHLGSTSLVVDDAGQVLARQWYYPYGGVRAGSGTLPTDFGYTGQRLDASTGGLMFYNARFYEPSIGRFISADTVAPQRGNPQTLNHFSYVLNSPLKYSDPSGHRECEAGSKDCDTKDVKPKSKNIWKWLRGQTQASLQAMGQSQLPGFGSGCAPFSMAMATNILTGGNISGANMTAAMETTADKFGTSPFSLLFGGYGELEIGGVELGTGMMPQDQARGLNKLFQSVDKAHPPFVAELKTGETSTDLIDNINHGYPTIVSISWGSDQLGLPTDPGIGHAMVVVGYNPSTGQFAFLDPAPGALITDFSAQYQNRDFEKTWAQGNVFIPGGSMVTLKPNP